MCYAKCSKQLIVNRALLRFLFTSLLLFSFFINGYSQYTKSQTICPDYVGSITIGQNNNLSQNGVWTKNGDASFVVFGGNFKISTVSNLDLGVNTLVFNDGSSTLTETVTNYKVFVADVPPICSAGAGTVVQLRGSNPNGLGTGTWSVTAGNPANVQFSNSTSYNTTATILVPGTYVFKWSISFSPAMCGIAEGSASVTITMTGPSVTISGVPSYNVCPGISRTITASAPGTVTYKWDDNTTNPNRIVAPTTTTTYTATVTDQAGCITVQKATIYVSNSFSLTSSSASYCAGSGVTLTLSSSESGISYQLKKGGAVDGAAVAGNGAPINWTNKQLGTYTVDAFNSLSNCTMSMGNITIYENPLPVLNTGTDPTGCEGTIFPLSASGATSYLWNTGATTSNINVSPTSTTTYSVKGTITATGCSATKNVVVTVNPLPASYSVTGGGNYCQGTAGLSVTLSGSVNGVTYKLLKNGIVDQAIVSPGGVLTWNNKTAGTYTVQASNANCSLLMNGSAVINEVALPTVYTLSGPTSYCANTTGVTLTLSGSQNGINYTLKKGGVSVGTMPGNGSPLSWSNITNGTYTVDASTVNPISCSVSMNGSITVAALAAVVVDAGADKTICKGESIQLGATGGSTYSWSPAVSLNNPSVWNPLATPAATTLYTVTITDNNGCVYTDQVEVKVRTLPDAVASTPQTICNGDSAILTATDNITGNNETYKWSTGSTKDTIYVKPSTNTTYFVTITDSYGCKNSTSTSVSVNPKPGVNAGSDTQICDGGSVTLNGSGNANTWKWINTGQTILSINVAPSSTTNYILKGTYTATGCFTQDTVKVTVNPLPVVSFTLNGGNNTKFCSNGALVSLVGTPAGGTFSSSAAGSISGTKFNPSVAGVGNHTITYTYTNASSCTNTITIPVEVVAPPVPTITGLNASYCNTNLPFTVTGNGVSGTWTFSGPAAAMVNNLNGTCTIDPTKITVQGTYSLTYTVSNSSGCSGSVTKTFVVKLGPSVDFVGLPLSVCKNANPVTLTGNQGTLGTFSGSGITDNANGTALFNPSSLVSGNYSVTFSYTDGATTCAATVSKSVTVNAIPTAYNVTGGGSYCAGSGGLIVGLSNSELGVNYQLYRNGISTGAPKAGTGAAIDFGAQILSGSYTVSAVNASNCTVMMTGSVTVTVVALPTVYTLSGPSNYCVGTNGVTLTLSGSQIGVSYTLKNGLAIVGTKGGTGSSINWTNIPDGSYTVEASVDPGLCAVAMLGTVTVNPPVAAPAANAGADKTICVGGSVPLNASGGISYSWSPAVGLNNVNSASPLATPAASTLYTVTVTYASGCSSTDQVLVTVRPLPNAVASPTQTICIGDQTVLTATDNVSGNNETYSWSTGSTKDTIIVKPTSNTTYFVTITDVYGCSASASSTVNVNPKPTVNAGSDAAICIGGSVTLNGSGTNNLSWLWSTGATTSSISVSPASTTDYIFRGTNNITRCYSQDTVKVTVNPLPVVSFTLNGGNNTKFCSNGALVSLVGTPVGGTFSSSAAGSISGTKFNPAVAGVGNHTITYTYTNANSCTNTITIPVEVVAPPVPTISGLNASYCNTSASFTVTGNPLNNGSGVFGTWTFSGPAAAMVNNLNGTCTIDPTKITVQGTYSLTYTVSNSSGCSGSVTKTFVVKLGPSVDFVGLPLSVCKNANPVTLTGNQGTLGTFSGSGITDNANGTASFNPSSLIPGNYSVTFSYTDAATTCAATVSKSVTVNAIPTAYNVTGGGSYCAGSGGLIVGLSNSELGVNYQLYRNGISTGAPKAGTGVAIDFGAQILSGSYTVSAVNASNCTVMMTGSVTVTAVALPTVYTLSGPSNYCVGTNGVTLTLSGSQIGVSYTLKNGLAIVGTKGGTGASLSWTNIPTGNYTVEATVDPGLCPVNMLGTVTVNAPVAAPVANAGADKTICAGGSVTLTASGGVSYSWSPAAGLNNVTSASPVASPAASTLYTVTVTNASGCSSTDQVLVTVRPLPDAVASAPQTICIGDEAIITATDNIIGNNETYLWSTGSTADFIKVKPTSNTNYNVTITDAFGCSASASSTVNVNPKPAVNAGSDAAICIGGNVTLNGSGANNLAWLWSTGATTSSISVSPASTTDYIFRGTNNVTGCYSQDTVKVTVNPLPVVSFTLNGANNTKFCSNGALVTLAGTPSGGTFSSSAAGSIAGTTCNPSVAGVGNHTITYTYTNANSCTNAITVPIEVVAPPVVNITGLSTSYCNTSLPFTLTGNPLNNGSGVFGTWSFSGPAAALVNNLNGTCTIDPSKITVEGSYIITYTVANSSGCSSSISKTFDIKAGPTVNFVGLPSEICQNASPVTITGNQSGGTFTGNGITDNGNGSASFNPANLLPGNYSIIFSFTNITTSCSSSISKTIKVNSTPAIYAVTGGGSYCSGSTGVAVGLSGSTAGIGYELFINGITTGNIKIGNGAVLSFGNQLQAGNYTIKATDPVTSCSVLMNGNATITISPLPLDAPVINGAISVCPGNSENYTIPAIQNATDYLWGLPSNATVTAGAGTNSITVLYAANAASGNITVQGRNLCGTGAKSNLPVVVKVLPSAAGAITGTQTVCQNEKNVVYKVPTIANASSYLWTVPSGAIIVSGQGTETIVVDYGLSAVSGSITVKGMNACGNGLSSATAITVVSLPQLTKNSPSGQITCSGNTVTVSATSSTLNVSYLWTALYPGNITGATNSSSTTVNAAGKYVISVISNVNSCIARDTIVVVSDLQAPQNVNITFSNSGQITCNIPEIDLSATTTSTFPVGYSWTASAGGNIKSGALTATPKVDKGGVYEVKVTNLATGCFTTKSVTISEAKVLPDLTVTSPAVQKLSCNQNTVTLSTASTTSGVTYSWSGSGILSGGNGANPVVNAAGTFTVTATAPNGCTSTATVQVLSDNQVANINVSQNPNELNCTTSQVTLSGTSTTVGATLMWNGPGIVSGTTTSSPVVDQPGVYTLTVKHPISGCTVSSLVTVIKNTTAPTVTFPVIPAVITCGQPNTIIQSSTSATNKIYLWSTADGAFVSAVNIKDVVVSKPGTYTLKVTDTDNGCFSTASITTTGSIVLPDVQITAPSNITCSQPTIQLNGSTTTAPRLIEWSTSDGTIDFGANSLNPTISKGGTYQLKITNTSTQCYSIASVTVTENKTKPVISIDKAPPVMSCATPLIQLNGNAPGANLVWTGPVGALITNNTSTAPTVDKPGKYYLTATNAFGCVSKDSTVVTSDFNKPVGLSIDAPATITCSTPSISLTGKSTTPSASFKWTALSGSISGAVNSNIISVTAAGVYKMVVTHPVSFCMDSLNVTVLQDLNAPSISFPTTPATITCTQLTSTLNANISPAGSTLLWTGPGTISNATAATTTVNAAGVYTLKATHPVTGCVTTSTITVSDNKVSPAFSIAPAQPITCTTPNVLLDGTTALTNFAAQWTTTNGTIVGNPNNIDVLASKAGLYTLTITDNVNGCTSAQNVLVTANNSNPSITVDPNPNKLTCSVDKVKLFGTSSTVGSTYLWTGPGTIIDATTQQPEVSSIGTYTLKVTGINGCISTATVIVSEDKSTPAVPVIIAPAKLTCTKTTADLELSPVPANSDILWTTIGTGQIFNSTTYKAIVTAIGSYKVTVTNRTTGCSNFNTVTVNEDKSVSNATIIGGPYELNCSNTSLQLEGATNTGINPIWTASSGGLITANANSLKPTIGTPGAYTLTVTNPVTGCINSASITVTQAEDLPGIDFDPFPAEINCLNTSVTLSGKPKDAGTTFAWSANPGTISSNGNTFNPVVNSAGTYIITVTNTATGCVNKAAINVIENKTAPQAVIEEPLPFTCARTSVQIKASTVNTNAAAAWTTSGTGSIKAGDQNTWNPTLLTPATYTLTVTDLANKCTSTYNVVVPEDKLVPNISVDKTVTPLTCTVKQVTLSGNSTTPNATYLWSTLNGGNISNPTSKTPAVDAIGTYTLKVTDPVNGCSVNDNVTVTNDIAQPQIWVNTTPGVLNCVKDTVYIKGNSLTTNVTYNWSGPGVISNAAAKEPYVNAPGVYLLTVTSVANGCTNELPVTVTRNVTVPAAPLLTGNSACYGASATALTAVGTNVQWYSNSVLGNAFKVQSGNSYTPLNYSNPGDYSFYATQTDAVSQCTSAASQIIYTIRSLPVAPVTVNKTICEGDPNNTLTVAGNNITWYNTPGGASIATGTYTPAVTAPGTYTYYVTQTDGFSCESPAKDISLTIQPKPAKPIVNQLTASVCSGSVNPEFTASGTSLQWYASPTLPAPVKTGGAFTPLVTTSGTYSYYVTQTSSFGCVSPYETVTLNILPLPQAFTVTGGGVYCENATGLSIGLSGSQLNTAYQLILNGTTVVTSMNGTGAALDFGLQKAAGNYTVKAKDNSSCEVLMSGGVAINVNPLPGNAMSITGQPVVCQGAVNIAYTVPAIANASSYSWTVPSGAVITSGLNTRSITLDFGTTSATGNVSVIASNGCGSGAVSPNFQVIVNRLPAASGNIKVNATNDLICLGDSGIIYEVDPIADATTYEWVLPAGSTVYAGANSRQIRVKFAANAPMGSHTVKVRGVNSCGVGAYSAPYAISINPNPSVYAGIDQNKCSTDAVLQGSVIPAGGSGVWTQILGNASIINGTQPNSSVVDLTQGNNIFTWTVNYNGCSSIDTVQVFNNKVFVDAGEDLPLCAASVSLRGTVPPSGTSGIWTIKSGSASFQSATKSNTVTSNFGYGDNVLYWTITKNGCQSRDSIRITNYRPAAPDAGADQNICVNQTVLNAVTPLYGSGKWTVYSGKATFADDSNPRSAVSGIGKGKNIFFWTVTNMICSLTDTMIVNNNEVDVNAGYDQVVCENRTTLDATAAVTGSSGQWSVLQGSASFLDNRAGNTKISGLVNGPNKLIWSITKGSCVNSDTVTIVCNMPSRAMAGADQFLPGGNAIMDATQPVVGTGKWSVISGAANFTNINLYNTAVSGLNPGANILRWTVTFNGCSTFDDVSMSNGTIEQVDAGQDQVVCTNQTVLEAARPQYGFGVWTVQKGSANFENNEAYNSKVTNLAAGSNILRWSVIVSGIEFYDTVIIVNNQPTQALTGPKQILCIDSTSLTGNIPVQGTGKWTLEGGAGVIKNVLQNNTKVTGLASGDNIFRWTVTKGTCVSSALLVITNDRPTPADAGLDQTICDDKSTLIPNPVYIGTGEWSVVSGSGSFNNNEVTGLARGQNVLRWTIRKNNCSFSDDMVVISNKPTAASAGLNTIVCVDSLVLSANKANALIGEKSKWTIMNGSGIIKDSTLNTSVVTKLAQGVNVLRWTINNNGCISYSDVQVNYAYVKSDAGVSLATCDNHVILNANNPSLGLGEWSVVGGSGSAVFTNPNSPNTEVKNLDQGKNILRWTISNFSCASSSEVIITNNAPSIAFAGGDQSLCVNNTVLAARQPFVGKGSWSVLSGSGLFADSSVYNTRVYNVGSGSNTYRWTVRNQNCISTDEVVVANNKPIGTYAGLDQTLCLDSAMLSANQPIVGSGVWSIIKGAGQIQNMFNAVSSIVKLAPDTNIVRWTVTNKQCVEFQEIKLVNNVPTVPSAGADRVLCSDQASMDGNAPVYGIGEWQVISGSGTFTNKNIYNTEVRGLTLGKNTFRWKISKNGCVLNDDVILTNDLPTKPNAGTDIAVCDNNSPLNANKPAIGTGYWSIVSGKGTFIDSTQYNTRIVGLGQGSNLLTWTTIHNRCALTDVVEVLNNLTNVYAGPDQTVYENSSILVGNEPLRGVGTWTLNGGGGNIGSANNFESTVTGLAEGINTFLWSVDISGCISSDAVQITYYKIPTASFSASQTEGCPPLQVRFTKTTIEKYPYQWYFGNNNQSTEENPVVVYDKPGKYYAKLVVTGPDGKPVESIKTIVVRNLPQAKFDLVPAKVYIPEEELRCFNYSVDSKTYLWDFGDGNTSTDLNPNHVYKDSGTYTVKLKVWSEYGCIDSLIMENGVQALETSKIRFPSAFSPNSSGTSGGAYNRSDYSNDVFYPIIITGEIQNYHLEIYNRWGVLVFESKDVNIGWDGYYKNKLMMQDIYIYRVTGKMNSGKKVSVTGDFMLMRKDY